MKAIKSLLSLLTLLAVASCGSRGTSSQTDGGGGTGASGGAGGSAAAGGDAAVNACVTTGGVCDCVGSCPAGYVPASAALSSACPQPRPSSGACGQGCCVPVGSDAGG